LIGSESVIEAKPTVILVPHNPIEYRRSPGYGAVSANFKREMQIEDGGLAIHVMSKIRGFSRT